jgi:hypothetical protein
MKTVRQFTGKLALTLTLAVAALLLPTSPAHAWQGHGRGHAGWGGAGHSGHHGHHPYSGGYGWTWGGYYPYLGYDSFYGGSYGYGIYYGAPPFDAYGAPWGVVPASPSGTYQSTNFIDLFR